MGGKRCFSFRQGDRSEYLATYALSRLAFVTPVPRQEDFGVVDLIVITADNINQNFYPRATCCVQIKSDENDLIFDNDSVNWISEYLHIPLYIVFVNKKQQYLKIFSTWNMWTGLFACSKPASLTLKPNCDANYPSIDNNNIVVGIGKPIIEGSLDEYEEKASEFQKILNRWVEIDQGNLARKSIGRNHVFGLLNHEPNKLPDFSNTNGIVNWYFFGKQSTSQVEISLAPILTALAHGYRHNKEKFKYECVVNLMKQLPIELLDEHGQGFINGNIKYDSDENTGIHISIYNNANTVSMSDTITNTSTSAAPVQQQKI